MASAGSNQEDDIARLATAATADRPVLHWLVRRRIEKGKLGPGGRTLLTMVHAWAWSDNPDGRPQPRSATTSRGRGCRSVPV